jgi:hypothetical protein
MIIIKNNKNKLMSVFTFTLIQLIIYFTNRSQILYINSNDYNSFYILFFISLYPLAFVLGSLFNQLLIKTNGDETNYPIIFNIACMALCFNQLYESYWSWLLFRFIYSFCMGRLFWIANDYLMNPKLSNSLKDVSYRGVIKLSIIRFTNIFSNILIGAFASSYDKVVTVSVILLQMAQIFFNINNRDQINSYKSFNQLKFFIEIYINLYKNNPIFTVFFFIFTGLHYTYLTWLIIIISHFKQVHPFFKWVIAVFALGEIFSTYIFIKEDDSIVLHRRILLGCLLFAIVNFFLFIVFSFQQYGFIIPLFLFSGIILSKFNGDLENLVFQNQTVTDRANFDFSNTILKNILSIIVLIITFHIAAYKAYGIFIILFVFYGVFFNFLGIKKIHYLKNVA